MITFADIAQKLLLDSPEDAEFIVAKAIRDGVIEAVLDHDSGTMQSKDTSDVYSTREPQIAFNQRIEFCLELHNHSVKAMRFPPKSYNRSSSRRRTGGRGRRRTWSWPRRWPRRTMTRTSDPGHHMCDACHVSRHVSRVHVSRISLTSDE